MSDRNSSIPTGPQFWRSLEDLAGSPGSLNDLGQEFPTYEPKDIVQPRGTTRRSFMQLMAASMALAGLTASGCRRWPKQEIVAQTTGMKNQTPGIPERYATIYDRAGVGYPLLVTAWDGRPIKVEGNNLHPAVSTFDGKVGASDIYAQGTTLEMYDPDRSRGVLDFRGPSASTEDKDTPAFRQISLASFYEQMGNALSAQPKGAGVAVLAEASSSVTLADLKGKFLAKYPQARWVSYEPTAPSEPLPRIVLTLDKAQVIVSIDADILGTHPNKLAHARDWARGRKTADQGSMNRLYLSESVFSTTGTAADVRLPSKATQQLPILSAIAAKLGVGSAVGTLSEAETKFVDRVVADLQSAGKHGVVIAGDHLGQAGALLSIAINNKLASAHASVVAAEPSHNDLPALKKLAEDCVNGVVKVLLILGGNPAFNGPADLRLADAIQAVPNSAHLSLFVDETSQICKWHVNQAHYFEAWGDARSYDGTISIQQPIILPLFDGPSSIEFIAKLSGDAVTDGQSLVKRTLGLDSAAWQTALHDGLVKDSAFKPATVNANAAIKLEPQSTSGLEVRFVPSQGLFDGRYANNGWLQEMPDSLTKLVWDNAVLISKADADAAGIKKGDLVSITLPSGKIDAIPAFILWGQPVGVLTLTMGYGRTGAGRIGNGVGFNTFTARASGAMHIATNASVAKTGGTHTLVSTQDHQQMDWVAAAMEKLRIGDKGKQGRIIREASLEEYKKNPKFVDQAIHRLPLTQLFDSPYKTKPKHPDAPTAFNYPHAWGMSIDMNSCIGCNACVIACQAENNVPIVGKDQVAMNRDMHWIRLDRYFKVDTDEGGMTTDFANVEVAYMPVACMQCENAPCEQVCPVAATVHDTEGLNTMVYNRCIGTRYCANNCPYKVRRFNYFDWQSRDPRGGYFNSIWFKIPDQQQNEQIDPLRKLQFNPDVSVRMRGVMEKCTYCTQRIKAATIQRKNEFAKGSRDQYYVEDFDIVTACMNVCPTQAITFGNLNDKDSAVLAEHKSKRAYAVLEELNTRPRTMYLAKIRNGVNSA